MVVGNQYHCDTITLMDNNFLPRRPSGGSSSLPEPQNPSDSTAPKPLSEQMEDKGLAGGENPTIKPRFKIPGLASWKQLSSKQRLISLTMSGLLLIAATFGALALFTSDPPVPEPVRITPKAEPPKPTTLPSPLTGIQVSPELAALPITGVMIENSPDARPQSGLNTAGVVFEAIAEGGITRFLALYQEDQPDYIGPVRSVRPYYLDFLVPFDAAIAHAGGSGDALAQIRNEGIKDIDHGANGGTYQRVSSRFAPHNLYTSRAQLLEAHNRRGYTTSKFTAWPRKQAETPLEIPTINTINFNISGQLYNTTYSYDKATNSYKRTLAGRPHTDERSGEQISPKVVIAIIANRSQNGIYSVYQVTGGGPVLIFQDGGIVEGTWEKQGRGHMYVFKTADGKAIELNPGRAWVTLVAPGGVQYAP